ncbi:Cysteine-rich secretory protein family protein [Aliiruegeria haliotis]|uniref:Cysteine-rich secretory protein family protein n=1 Tax=Aliiruegeria haliotis TaxID=1280846 RepID=A0A2T0RR28_9RHOB|nr:CAP domain-containing protein [Aliiruegeria haliotis]PRY23592.1 Cysteine-rich secretory protein family protein [Aliiruegeria haliotis]
MTPMIRRTAGMLLALASCIALAGGVLHAPSRETASPLTLVATSDQVGALINSQRQRSGRAALARSAKLDKAAARHVSDMARTGSYSHKGTDGSTHGQRIRRTGYKACWAAENIGWGWKSASSMVGAWMGSGPHKRNILSRKARQFGAARGAGDTWVLVLARPC